MINYKLGENAYNSSWKANLSNNKEIQDIDKKKAHNPTGKNGQQSCTQTVNKTENINPI